MADGTSEQATEELAGELRPLILRLSRRIRRERSDVQVSDSQLLVLFQLERAGALTPGELAELEQVSPPSMNRTLNGLEEAGYVRRTPSPEDRRKVIVEPTEAGSAVVRSTRTLRTLWLRERLAGLDPAAVAALAGAVDALRKLAGS